jgi:hypothetical protein
MLVGGKGLIIQRALVQIEPPQHMQGPGRKATQGLFLFTPRTCTASVCVSVRRSPARRLEASSPFAPSAAP